MYAFYLACFGLWGGLVIVVDCSRVGRIKEGVCVLWSAKVPNQGLRITVQNVSV